MSAWRAKITLCSGLCCSTCLVRWLNENKTSLCLALTPSGNHQWKKKGPKWKVQEVIIRFEFSILCKDTKSWGCNCGCQVWWCLGRECVFAAFIMTISDKNWKGCVYRLHPVTSMHTFSNLCVEHLSLFLWLKISRNEKEPVKNRN